MPDRLNRAGTSILKRLFETTRITFAALAILAASPALAQPAPTPEEVQQAQVRWNEGKAYFDAGNFEAARVAFKQAYTVFPHAAFLQNLGEAELRTGRSVEAARHFTAFLRASSSGSPAQRELAKKSLAKAAERLGSIVVTANVDDAEIRIDDDVVGRSPLGSLVWYVEPGRHVVTARKDGYLDGTEKVDVANGPPRSVLVRVQRVVGGTSEIPPEDPKPSGAPVGPAVPTARIVNGSAVALVASPDSRRGAVPARTVVLLSGAALTVGAAAVGTIYALQTGTHSSQVHDSWTQLAAVAAERGVDPVAVCHEPQEATLIDTCRQHNDDVTRWHADRRVRDIAFVSAGVFGVATLATFFIWRPRPSSVSVAPALSPGAPGLVVFGSF